MSTKNRNHDISQNEKYIDFLIKDYEQLNQHLITTDGKIMTLTGFYFAIVAAIIALFVQNKDFIYWGCIFLCAISVILLIFTLCWKKTREKYLDAMNELRKEIVESITADKFLLEIWKKLRHHDSKIFRMSNTPIFIYIFFILASILTIFYTGLFFEGLL